MQALAVCLCFLIGLGGLETSQPPLPFSQSLTPEAQALIAPILKPIVAEQRRQALQPAPKDNGKQIIRRRLPDQVGQPMEARLELPKLSERVRAARWPAWWGAVLPPPWKTARVSTIAARPWGWPPWPSRKHSFSKSRRARVNGLIW